MKKLRKSIVGIILLITLILSTGIVFATTNSGQSDMSTLRKDQILDSTGFFAGDNVTVEGRVKGTTFAAGSDIRISGRIDGDLFIAGENIYIDGLVKGNIYGAATNVYVSGKNDNEVFVAGETVIIEESADVGRDLFAAGTRVTVNGKIGRNADISGETINLGENSKIDGDLTYRSEEEGNISSGAVGGETTWKTVDMDRYKMSTSTIIWMQVISIVSALLIYLVVELWRPGFWDKNVNSIMKKPGKTFGIGLLSIVVIPIISIIFMITIVGIPLGFIALLLYGLGLYLSRIIVAVCIGRFMEEKLKWSIVHKGIWTVLLGLLLLSIISIPQIPVLSFIVGLVIISLGLGSLIISNYRVSRVNSSDQ